MQNGHHCSWPYILNVNLNVEAKSNSELCSGPFSPSPPLPPLPPSWTPCDTPRAEQLSVGSLQEGLPLPMRAKAGRQERALDGGSRDLSSKPTSVANEQPDLGQIPDPVWPLLVARWF